jgi:hypothetical protein
MFLLPMYVAACRVAGRLPEGARRDGMVRYLRGVINQDGAVGLHEEDGGSMFTTVLAYVALRFLGVPRDDPDAARMRAWIRANGTALGAASWGKVTLAVLNLYPWDALPPLPPELWLLPRAAPFHPGRFWCHSRVVYLPMAWLYGTRACIPEDDAVRELRADLYDRPWPEIDFARFRHGTAPSDARYPVTRSFRAVSALLAGFERLRLDRLRRRALDETLEHIRYDDRMTSHINLGPVNSVLHAIVHHFHDPGSDEARRSFEALEAYLETTPRGVHFNG